MSPAYRKVLQLLVSILIAVFFIVVMSSVIGLLLTVLLYFCFKDLADRQRRNMTKNLNSAICAVSQHDGSIAKIAAAFSRRGPLRGPCYEFARRLMMGEPPIEAAAMSRVPLQLSTAVALESPSSESPSSESPSSEAKRKHATRHLDASALPDWNMMPVYAQLLYLSLTVLCTCLVLAFLTVFVVPTFEWMFEEFGYDMPHAWWSARGNGLSPSWLLLPAVLLMLVVPIWSGGHIFGLRLPRWLPSMPRIAEQRAEMLTGIADAMDAGWPVRRTLDVASSISQNLAQRRDLQSAVAMIDQGIEPAAAFNRVGWIDVGEASWLTGASSGRTAELLRTIADQGVRNATANLHWVMAIVFPVVVLILGVAVLAYASDMFAMLTGVIR